MGNVKDQDSIRQHMYAHVYVYAFAIVTISILQPGT